MIKQRVLLLGSVPMSLGELALAPAMIGAAVRQLGHDFAYQDINLMLFEHCDRDHNTYVSAVEFLQDKHNWNQSCAVIDRWQARIDQLIDHCDLLLVNVFSMFSHVPALRIAQQCRQQRPTLPIVMGGLGGSKRFLGGIDSYHDSAMWTLLCGLDNDTPFGAVCEQLGVIDAWQPDAGMDVLYQRLPRVDPMTSPGIEYDFTGYCIDQYQWPRGIRAIPMLGSHGCVRQCSFCDVIKYFPRYSFVEADALTKSIAQTCDQTGINRVQFMDSLVNGSMSNFLSLLQNLAHARRQGWLPSDFSWSGTYICRPPSSMLDHIHQHLRESGADNLVIGVETGSDRVRFEMQKKFTNDDLLSEVAAFRQQGVKCSGLFFPSWPTETRADFDETLRLFDRLSEYAQCGTVESINLGTNGFALIDGTGIDHDRDRIGLEPGPLPWLWRCHTNPELTFYETLRRRLLMAEWCEMLGLQLDGETESRRHLVFNLEQHHELIRAYAGRLQTDLSANKCLPSTLQHRLQMCVINSGTASVTLTVATNHQHRQFSCDPGESHVDFEFVRHLSQPQDLWIDFEFGPGHRTEWDRYDSGDYYDRHGIYLSSILFDHADVTFWGWHHTAQVGYHSDLILPAGYATRENRRCVTKGMSYCLHMPAGHSIHKTLLVRQDQNAWEQRTAVDLRMQKCLANLM